jgi:hypothetical protein
MKLEVAAFGGPSDVARQPQVTRDALGISILQAKELSNDPDVCILSLAFHTLRIL